MVNTKSMYQRPVYIIDGARTPYLKARGKRGPFTASDLSVEAGRELLLRQPFSPESFDEVIVGCVMPSENEANIARIIALRLGCGDKMPAFTVQRNCASGMQSIDDAAKDIASGRADLVLAGGTESMSHAPIMFNAQAANWMSSLMMSRSFSEKLMTLLQFRPRFLRPIIGLKCGLTDPIVGLMMGQTAENLAGRFNITREQMDQFSIESHQRITQAMASNHLPELIRMITKDGKVFDRDDGVRPDAKIEKLKKLKPFFDRFGDVTPANSSQVTDGATMLILASEDAVNKYNLNILAEIKDCQWAALDPAQMGLGPTYAMTPILQRQKLNLKDIDYFEINEAFAAQVIACVEAWKDKEFCQNELGLSNAVGEIDSARLNVDGGAVAIGHPVGSSGARIVLHLAHVLKRNKAKRGVASICIGGGQGGAMLIEV